MPQALVEISDLTLDALLSRADALDALPSLFEALSAARRNYAKACMKCDKGRKAKAALVVQYERTRLAIVSLSPANLATLKRLLDAERIRVFAGRTGRGVPVRHTL